MIKDEINVTCNDGTKFKIKFKRKEMQYFLYYRNDVKPLLSVTCGKVKGKWLYLDSADNYSDVLDFMCAEIKNIDAVYGF